MLSRWTRTDDPLPESVLNLIHPLTHEKARELWTWLSTSTGEPGSYLFNPNAQPKPNSLFTAIEQYNITLQNFALVQKWLQIVEPVRGREVIVSWTKTAAVVVPWWVFYTYFDDFCYPHIDDVDVWPLTEEWALFYSHKNQVVFGKLSSPLSRSHQSVPIVDKAVQDEVLQLLQTNQQVAAIKLYKRKTGVRLIDAQNMIDSMMKNLHKDDNM